MPSSTRLCGGQGDQAYGGDMVEESDKGTSWQVVSLGPGGRDYPWYSDPDKALSGHKVRSFYNKHLPPGQDRRRERWIPMHLLAVGPRWGRVQDTRQGAGVWGQRPGAQTQLLGGTPTWLRPTEWLTPTWWPAAHGRQSTPADLQAITWKRWRDLMPAAAAGKKGHTRACTPPKDAYPVLASCRTTMRWSP